jgi:hypothetical protein
MRRLIAAGGLAVLFMVGLTACPGSTSPPGGIDPVGLQKWKTTLEHPQVVSNPPPLIRNVLNVAIRAGIPVVCPAHAGQAAPEWRSFVTATCDSIVASDDQFTTTTTTLPALCAGNPPIGASVFPTLATPLTATCPLILQLPPLLKLTQYVPLF